MKTENKYCVIGAGPCGLAALRNFRQSGIPVDCLEKEADIGGLWNIAQTNSSVYATTHLITSKKNSNFSGFPMPRDYPFYPHHEQVMQYFRSFADNYGLYEDISFGKAVERIEPDRDRWKVKVAGEAEPRLYKGVVIANGHYSVPNMPDDPGTFSGEIIHSHRYKSPAQLEGKRLLVVGTGNSGCDIVSDGVGTAKSVFHSMRHGFYLVPKFVFGRPTDQSAERIQRWPVPEWLRGKIYALSHRISVGRVERFGLPKPKGGLQDQSVTIAPLYLHHIGHGKIGVKPAIEALKGDKVRFEDGSEEQIDMIVYATGYKVDLPFIDDDILFTPEGDMRLYMKVFHPDHDNLFVLGLLKFDGGLWPIADRQSQLVANFITASEQGAASADRLRSLKSEFVPGGGAPAGGTREERLWVNYFQYRRELQKALDWLCPSRKAA